MKYICLGSQQNGLMDECFAYDDVLREGRSLCWWGSAPKRLERHRLAVAERLGVPGTSAMLSS
jgi:hypothetical protein